MDLFNRNRDNHKDEQLGAVAKPEHEAPVIDTQDLAQPHNNGEPEPLEPTSTVETDYVPADNKFTQLDRNWRAIAAQVAVALIVLVIILFGGRWLHHELTHKNTVKLAAASTKNLPPAPQATGSSQSTGSSSGSTQTSTNSSTSNSNLPNTGPGDDLTIFLAVSLAVASLHYANNWRKSQN